MATVRLSDVIIPDVWASYSDVDDPTLTRFLASGIVTQSAALDAYAEGPSLTGTMPYWGDLDFAAEPDYSNDDPADIAGHDKIGTGQWAFRKALLNHGWSSMDVTAELLAKDPMEAIKRKTSRYWLRQLQTRIIAIGVGMYNTNVAENSADMVIDISVADAATATAENRINGEAVINAAFTMGDRAGGFSVIAIHSMVAARMSKNDEFEYEKDSQGRVIVTYYKGMQVVIDDSMPVYAVTNGYKYLSMLFAPGVIGMGVGTPEVPVAVTRDENAGNGGGMEMMRERKTWLLHPFGHDWVEGSLTELSPTLADLRLAAHWDRELSRKLVGVAFLMTN